MHEVARRVRSVLRREDVAGRWGGDELIVVLPFTDLAAAEAVGERIRLAVRAQAIPLGQGDPRRGDQISIGCAAGLAEPSVLVLAADEALYGAKRAGRDTVRS